MKNKTKALVVIIATLLAVFGCYWLLKDLNFAVVNPAGEIAEKQKNLIVFTLALSLIVVVPVFIMTFWFAYKYRASNKKAKYSPQWDSNKQLEMVWWGIPIAIILLLSIVTWKTSHSLDPYRPLDSSVKPLTVQVVALDWKWLFIYPEYNIASVNELNIPINTPIDFEITSDAPMNSFWIPQLGGQIYAMAGMETKLHLSADKPGSYYGSSANLSGQGFAGMNFETRALNEEEFNMWVGNAGSAPNVLGWEQYQQLAKPSKNDQVAVYVLSEKDLYNKIIMKYMAPTFKPGAQMVEQTNKDNANVKNHNHGNE